MTKKTDFSARGRQLAIFMAVVGLLWILVTEIGREYGWSQHTRLFFDLAALAAFGFGLWLGINLWRDRRRDEE